MRLHKKADGILMIADDGKARFLSRFERIILWLSIRCEMRTVLTILIIAALACIVALALSSCADRHQPPCGDCWLAVQ